MDQREQAFREYLIEVLAKMREKYPDGYIALSFELNNHPDHINGGIMKPDFSLTFYNAEFAANRSHTHVNSFKELTDSIK
jgi:hypothetical protein